MSIQRMKQQLKAYTAFTKDPHTVLQQRLEGEDWGPCGGRNPDWDSDSVEFRVHPAPFHRVYKGKELGSLVGMSLENIETGKVQVVVGTIPGQAAVQLGRSEKVNASLLLSHHVIYATGEPCGVLKPLIQRDNCEAGRNAGKTKEEKAT
jgi:hypothetical protein